ncbi:MAG: arsenate reductase family protein [Gemmatimonadaceae bacterium]
MPSPETMEVQIFGVKKNSDTRKAQRFFAERRIKMHFVDLTERTASLGEIQRGAQKFGIGARIDRDSRCYGELGLGSTRVSDGSWIGKLAEEPGLLRIPLVRSGNLLTIGLAEEEWRYWTSAK